MPKKKRGAGEGSITQRPDGRWMSQITIGRKPDGKPRRLTLYGKTRREAADKLTKALGDRQNGTLVGPNQVTLGQWLDTWLQGYKKARLRPTTFSSYEQQIRVHIKPAVGLIPLRDLRPDHLQWLYSQKLDSGLSPTSVRYIHHVLHAALEQAVKNQLVVRNVSEATEIPPAARREISPMTLEQVKQLLGVNTLDRLYAAILLELTTGVRRGELLAIHWTDVDLTNGVIKVEWELVRVHDFTSGAARKTRLLFQPPKTPQSRRSIPLSKEALEELIRHKARQEEEKSEIGPAYTDNDLVFCTVDGKPLEPRNFTRHFDLLLKKAGLPHIRFHDTRHTFATLLLELGENPKVVQDLLGHSRIAVTLDTYSHVSLELGRRATGRLGEALSEGSTDRPKKPE